LKLGELVHYGKECLEVIICSIKVIPFAFVRVSASGETDTGRAFNVNNMSLFVPRVWVSSEISSSISERVRTVLLKEAKHG
jgi:hypothetical protein